MKSKDGIEFYAIFTFGLRERVVIHLLEILNRIIMM